VAAKKLVSMRLNNITDEKLTALADEIGETKANLISMAVTYLYDKYQEEKRMKEIASQAESFLEKHFASLSYRDRITVAGLIQNLRRTLSGIHHEEDLIEGLFAAGASYIPDAFLDPVIKTLSEFLEALEARLFGSNT